MKSIQSFKVSVIKSAAIFAILTVSCIVHAEVKLPAVIGDNMLLQQGIPAAIWGWAQPGEKISITFASMNKTCVADANGRWQVRLDPLKAELNQVGRTMTIKGKNTVELHNILVGEVWLCGGQSNMQYGISQNLKTKELAQINQPEIRLFIGTDLNLNDGIISGQWSTCSGQGAAALSAVAYYFGSMLHKELGIPVALITNPVGGTPAEAWVSHDALASDPQLKQILERCDKYMKDEYKEAEQQYFKSIANWEKEVQTAKAEGKTPPYKPYIPFSPKHPCWPSKLFNGRVEPIIPYTMRGVIWYQGESNVENRFSPAQEYSHLFTALINDWRSRWGQGDFPFYYVQIAPFHYWGGHWEKAAIVRDEQAKVLAAANTGMAGTMDIGEPNDIHPKNKLDVGRRLALLALARTYGRQIVCSGPMYQSHAIEGSKIRVKFSETGSGLAARNGNLKEFEIAGEDRIFKKAHAEIISGSEIMVSCETMNKPAALRYGWRDDAELNLFNKEGLPASPFRTDNWQNW